jgi:hypothetical protein
MSKNIRVARWFVFKPKIPILVNFEGLWNGECWNVLFFGHLEHFTVTWYILWPIGNLVGIWYTYIPRFGICTVSKKSGNPEKYLKRKKIFLTDVDQHLGAVLRRQPDERDGLVPAVVVAQPLRRPPQDGALFRRPGVDFMN